MNARWFFPQRLRPRRRSDNDGAILAIVAILTVVLLGVAAFAVDYGYAYAQRRALSTVADGAAVAAAQEFQSRHTLLQSCESMKTAYETAAVAAADLIRDQAAPANTQLTTTITCPTGGYLLVTASAQLTNPAFFGSIYGAGGYELERVAQAVVAPAGSVSGNFKPFGVCETEAEDVLSAFSSTLGTESESVIIHLAKTAGQACGLGAGETTSGSGNESRISLDPSYANFLAALLAPGPTRLTIDANGMVQCPPFSYTTAGWCGSFTGEGGFNNDERDAVSALLDEEFMFPVYDKTENTGSSTGYRISGFMSAKLCGWQVKNIEESQGKPKVHPGTCYDGSALKKLDKADGDALQLRAARVVPPSELATCLVSGASNTPCSLSDSNYEFHPVVSKLFG